MMNFYTFNDRDAVPEHIEGISCNVKNCVHHDGENYCTLDKINVGPSYATSSIDTVCASFKRKNMS